MSQSYLADPRRPCHDVAALGHVVRTKGANIQSTAPEHVAPWHDVAQSGHVVARTKGRTEAPLRPDAILLGRALDRQLHDVASGTLYLTYTPAP